MAQNKKAQMVVEVALLLVISIVAFIAVQPMIKRSVEGRMRALTESGFSEQFSPRWTDSSTISLVHVSTNETNTFGDTARNTQRGILSDENVKIATVGEESAELKK